MRQGSRIEFANTLRGVAALVVVISHYLDAFWTNRAAVAYLTLADELPFSEYATPIYVEAIKSIPVLSLGAFGVAIFFLISGFVIPFSLGRSGISRFLVSRAFRIYPVYAVGFSMTLLLIYASSHWFGKEFEFSVREVLVHYAAGMRDVLGSRNIDSIIWTLEIEVKFYIFFAIAYFLAKGRGVYILLAPIFLFALSMIFVRFYTPIAMLSPDLAIAATAVAFSGQFIVFMFCGVAIHYIYKGIVSQEIGFSFIVSYLLMFMYQWSETPLVSNIKTSFSYGFAVLVFVVCYAMRDKFRPGRVTGFFADISYPLYVIHGVGGYVVLRILLESGVKAWVAIIIVFSGAVLLSWIMHKVIEVPMQRAGKSIFFRDSDLAVKQKQYG